MTVKSLNNTFRDLASGDNLSPSQKDNLLTQYNSNISGIQNQLGYKPTYGATTNPSRSAVQVINSAYDTSGNGGRKFTRLTNGTLIVAVKTSTPTVIVYKSTDNGLNWSVESTFSGYTSIQDCAIVSVGNIYYLTINFNNTSVSISGRDVQNAVGKGATAVDSSQTSLGNASITYSPTDNKLKATWASKNATYPNSFNIRYAEGTIASDGSVSWGSVTQVTTSNTINVDYTNPCIIISNNKPFVFVGLNGSGAGSQDIRMYDILGSSFKVVVSVAGTTYTQFSPSATVDGNGVIHVVWHGLDATDTTKYNIRYSKSTDGGVTWSAMLKLTTGNTLDQTNPTITYDNSNNLYVYFEGVVGSFKRIRSITFTGTWSSITDVTTNTTAHINSPSLCDNLRTFTSPLVIWQDNVSPSVKFSGTWTDTPITAETVTSSAVSNKALIDAVISKGIGARTLSGTVMGSAGTSSFIYLNGGTATLSSITVTGLPFKPIFIYAFSTIGVATYATIYSESTGDQYPKTIKVTQYNNSLTTPNAYHIKGDTSPASVVNGSFTLPVATNSVSYTWIAFG